MTLKVEGTLAELRELFMSGVKTELKKEAKDQEIQNQNIQAQAQANQQSAAAAAQSEVQKQQQLAATEINIEKGKFESTRLKHLGMFTVKKNRLKHYKDGGRRKKGSNR